MKINGFIFLIFAYCAIILQGCGISTRSSAEIVPVTTEFNGLQVTGKKDYFAQNYVYILKDIERNNEYIILVKEGAIAIIERK